MRLWVAAEIDPAELDFAEDLDLWRCLGVAKLEEHARDADAVLGHGRGAARRVVIAGRRGVWRTNRHGGVVGRLLGERFRRPTRLGEEITVSNALRARGLPTPLVLVGLALAGIFWVQHLITEEVEDAVTVFEARDNPGALAAADALLDQLCAAGLWATDLHPGNMLWQEDCGRCWVIDLAGAVLKPRPLTEAERRARRRRFARYFRKHAGEVPAPFRV